MAADADIDALLADLTNLTGEDIGVKIGVLENATSIRGSKAGHERTMRVAEYAIYNEFGTKIIPPRPAFRSTADARGDEWRTALGNLIWGGTDAETALGTIGAQATADVQEAINEWRTPPNTPSTIKNKRSGRNNPLVDQGDLLASISFEITKGNHDGGA